MFAEGNSTLSTIPSTLTGVKTAQSFSHGDEVMTSKSDNIEEGGKVTTNQGNVTNRSVAEQEGSFRVEGGSDATPSAMLALMTFLACVFTALGALTIIRQPRAREAVPTESDCCEKDVNEKEGKRDSFAKRLIRDEIDEIIPEEAV